MWSLRSRAATSRLLVRFQQRRTMAEMPVPQSSKAVLFEGHPTHEGWESTVAWWYPLSFVMIGLILTTTPNTDITAWAQQEARARLQIKAESDEPLEFGKHYQDVLVQTRAQNWDKFSTRAVRMTDEDDDDEDEDEED